MFKKYTVANWMEDQGIPYTAEANRYEIGQELTYEQACSIVRMIRQGKGFMDEHPGQRNDWRRGCDPYRNVIFAFVNLLVARKKRNSNWDHMIWVALDEEEQIACNEISKDYFAYKYTMTKRLKEIYERVPRGYKVSRRMRRWL